MIAERYEHLWDLPPSGAQADVAVCRDRQTGQQVAVKIYRVDVERLDRAALELLRDNPLPHVMPVLAFESRAGVTWEVQEYLAGGSLDQRVEACGGRLPVADVRTLVEHLYVALTGVHAIDIVHRDLKPQNILLRAHDPLDFVLADFGLASGLALSQDVRSAAGTWAYMPPEAHNNIITRTGDWWALGVVVHEVATGSIPFVGDDGRWLPEQQIKALIYDGAYDLAASGDRRLDLLVAGLMTHRREHRWGATEVREWLDGGSPRVELRLGTPASSAAPAPQIRPFALAGQMYADPTSLAAGLREHWREVGSMLAGVKSAELRTWLERAGLPDVARAWLTPPISADRSSVGLQAALDPSTPPTFQGRRLDGPSLQAAIRESLDGDPEATTWIARLRQSRAMTVWASEAEVPPALALVDDSLESWWRSAESLLKTAPSAARDDVKRAREVIEARLLLAALDESRREDLARDARASSQLRPLPAWASSLARRGLDADADPGVQAAVAAIVPAAHTRESQRQEEERQAADDAERRRREAARAEHRTSRRRRIWTELGRSGLVSTLTMAAAAATTLGVSAAGATYETSDAVEQMVVDALPSVAVVASVCAVLGAILSAAWHRFLPRPQSRLVFAIVPTVIVLSIVHVAVATRPMSPWTTQLVGVAVVCLAAVWVGRGIDLVVDHYTESAVDAAATPTQSPTPARGRRALSARARRVLGLDTPSRPLRIGLFMWFTALVVKGAYINSEVLLAHPEARDWPSIIDGFRGLPYWFQDGVLSYLASAEPVHAVMRGSGLMPTLATVLAVVPALLLAAAPTLRAVAPRALTYGWVAVSALCLASASFHLQGLSVVLFGIGASIGFVIAAIVAVALGLFFVAAVLSG